MARVYVETTIPSYYHDDRTSPQVAVWRDATRRWWDEFARAYELVTSAFVLAELRRAPAAKAEAALQLLEGVRILDEPRGVREVAAHYIDHRLMPKDAAGDAAHVAMTSMHNIEFLLTWNCQHLANANKIQHLHVLNSRLGLSTPSITTPLNLIPETL